MYLTAGVVRDLFGYLCINQPPALSLFSDKLLIFTHSTTCLWPLRGLQGAPFPPKAPQAGRHAGSVAEPRDVTPKLTWSVSLWEPKHECGLEAMLPADMGAGSPAEELCIVVFWSNLPFIKIHEREMKLFPQLLLGDAQIISPYHYPGWFL